MTAAGDAKRARLERLEAALAAVESAPGSTVYQVSLTVPPAADPAPDHLFADTAAPAAACASAGETLNLLRSLAREGLVRCDTRAAPNRWYPAGAASQRK
jgi:hypothetical protein